MITSLTVLVVLLGASSQAAAPPLPAAGQAPAVPPPPAAIDPATSAFVSDAGVILVPVKPALTAAYEQVIVLLQEAMARDSDPGRRSAAGGWRVFKAVEADAKGNAVYLHLMLPAVPGFDYRPSLLLDQLVEALAPELLAQYRDAIAGAPSKLSLAELAHMAVAPAPVATPEPKKPGPG